MYNTSSTVIKADEKNAIGPTRYFDYWQQLTQKLFEKSEVGFTFRALICSSAELNALLTWAPRLGTLDHLLYCYVLIYLDRTKTYWHPFHWNTTSGLLLQWNNQPSCPWLKNRNVEKVQVKGIQRITQINLMNDGIPFRYKQKKHTASVSNFLSASLDS
jgi:hypothetical protein